jgi:predicted RNA-binding Zn ribbon-like protein
MAFDLNTNKFKFIGGNLSLDFVNTVSGRSGNINKNKMRNYEDSPRAEKINDYADLLTWCVKAHLMNKTKADRLLLLAEKSLPATEKVLRRALILRESSYRLFKSVIEGWEPEAADVEKLNKELSMARQHQKLIWRENAYVFQWIDDENALDSMLWQIADSTAKMLTTDDTSRIRHCGNDNCNWLFLDTSRNRSRHWCDMKDCGNLTKVRRFRQKQAGV